MGFAFYHRDTEGTEQCRGNKGFKAIEPNTIKQTKVMITET